jgi:hypothetical protein
MINMGIILGIEFHLGVLFYLIFSNTPFRKETERVTGFFCDRTLGWLQGEEVTKKFTFLQIGPSVKHGPRQYTVTRVSLQRWGL